MRSILLALCVAIIANFSNSFVNLPIKAPKQDVTVQLCNPICNCNERTLYRNYLIGLRRTRKLLNNSTNNINNINSLVSILNFTSKFVSNYTIINNTQVGAKSIVMSNIILDVSNVREIHIKTQKDVLIVELDKTRREHPLPQLLNNVNNLDSILNTLSLLAKILNIS